MHTYKHVILYILKANIILTSLFAKTLLRLNSNDLIFVYRFQLELAR